MQEPREISDLERDSPGAWGQALNEAQRAAVAHSEGPLLVIAGAGSGKTRTLTHRVARLVGEGVHPAAILLLTFTRKSSQEMLQRAARLLDQRCERVSGGTFHSFANLKLRQYTGPMGLSPDFAILDRTDAEALIAMIRKEIDRAPRQPPLPRKNTLADIFSRAANTVRSVADVLFADYPHLSDQTDAIADIFERYTRRKREHHFMDYDDLLIWFQRLLQDAPEVRRRISAAYRYIMVDEYQDTNRIQADILYHLTDANRNIMVVGDDSQSIYAFRGANFRNIIDFPKLFAGARIISLEENYRSTQPILNLTNIVIERAQRNTPSISSPADPAGSSPNLSKPKTKTPSRCLWWSKSRTSWPAGFAWSRSPSFSAPASIPSIWNSNSAVTGFRSSRSAASSSPSRRTSRTSWPICG